MRFPFEFKKHQRIIHFLWWDATPDLAQATWEWPPRYRMHWVKTTLEGVWWELR